LIYKWGFAPNPTSFFGLNQKTKQKSSRLRPFRSKNLRSLAKIVQTRSFVAQTGTIFKRQLHLFFGSSDEVNPCLRAYKNLNDKQVIFLVMY
jgi:hypothetical protein